MDAVPLLVPFAVPVGRAVQHPVVLRGGELAPRGVARDAGLARVLQQVGMDLGPGRRHDGLDGAVAQRLARIGNHQPQVDADHPAEAAAGFAGAEGRVEAEQRRLRVGITLVAFRAVQAGGIAPQLGLADIIQLVDVEPAAAALERQLDGLHHAHLLRAAKAEAVGHHVEQLLAFDIPLGLHARKAAGRQPLLDLLGRGVGGQFDREGEDQPRVCSLYRAHQQVGVDRLRRVMSHRQRSLLVEQHRRAREQQLQMVVQLGHRADRAAAGAHRIRLVDGDGRRHAIHPVHRRAVHTLEELPRIGAEGLDVAPLPFGIERVEHQAGLARTRRPGDHRHLAGADVEVQVLQVVLACAANADEAGRHVAAEPGSKGRSRAF